MLEVLSAFIKSQPILAGMGGATAAGMLLSHAKEFPGKVWNGLTDQFSISLTVHSEDQFFERLERWLSRHPSTRKMRRLRLAEWHDNAKHGTEYGIAPGSGLHVIWVDGKPFFFHRSLEQAQGDSGYNRKRKQTITIRTPGRSQAPILDLLERVRNVETLEEIVPVYMWNGHEAWRVDSRPKRSMDTVYLEPGLKTEIIDDLTEFLSTREKYQRRGTPWRRGYCFKGDPGCGKTTFIFALASMFGRGVYIIPLASISNDKELLNAVNAAGDSWIVIEDIDCVKATEKRLTSDKLEAVHDANTAGISRSGLLNAIDGIGAKEGRVLFITTNFADVLDSALLRPGRIDVNREFFPATISEAKQMFARFYPGGDSELFESEIAAALPMSQAELQNLLLTRERTLPKNTAVCRQT